MWTISGLYFSWTDIDQIHGDDFKTSYTPKKFNNLFGLQALEGNISIHSIELREIDDKPYYWINESFLFDGLTGKVKKGITEKEAVSIASKRMKIDLKMLPVELITETNSHHEYRERSLPAYVISYRHKENIKAYVSQKDGKFQTVRHRNWRWFDFLWMTHTMDYQGRDNFNTLLLRAFSLLGLITVLSGFLLWYISSPTVRKIKKRI